jgi:hypothetical protein
MNKNGGFSFSAGGASSNANDSNNNCNGAPAAHFNESDNFQCETPKKLAQVLEGTISVEKSAKQQP